MSSVGIILVWVAVGSSKTVTLSTTQDSDSVLDSSSRRISFARSSADLTSPFDWTRVMRAILVESDTALMAAKLAYKLCHIMSKSQF